MRRNLFGLGLSAGLIALWILRASAFGAEGTVKCIPPYLEKNLLSEKFHTVNITGQAPPGAQIILKIVSPNREFKLNKSGKGLGFVWLPVGHVEVKNIPGMCVLLSSGKVSEIMTDEQQKTAGLSPDFQEVYQQAQVLHQVDTKKEEAATLNREYLSGLIRILKEARLYQLQEGAVKVSRGQFEAELIHPAEAPLGEYRVLCYAVNAGKARLFDEQTFLVRSTGVAEWLSHQAHTNATAYGFLAALIAVGVGLFVGVLFKKGGGH